MNKFLKKAIVASVCAIGFSSAFAADVTVSNGGLTAVINDAGTFTSSSEFPGSPAGTPGLSFNGMEFVNWGTPISWYWLEAGGSSVAALGSNPLGASTTSAGAGTVATTLSFGALSLTQTVRALSGGVLQVGVSIFNSSGADITGVKWGVGFDPDQDVGPLGSFSTTNEILGQGVGAAVRATGAGGGIVTLRNDTSAGPTLISAYINSGDCCSPVDPASALGAGQAVGFTTVGDDSISLAYDMGTLAAGATATIGYSYVFAGPVPEPEIYAMMAAGLGLMGFVARRRKRDGTVV